MEGCSNKDVASPQLLDLIPRERNWFVQGGEGKIHGSSDEKKLELRLGPPGEEEREKSSNLSHGYFSNNNQNRGIYTYGGNGGFTNTFEVKTGENNGGWIMKQQQHSNSGTVFSLLQLSPQGRDIKAKESSQSCSNKGEDLQKNAENNSNNKKVFSPGSANPAVATNSSQKRTAPAPVVGWPPIRSFRKNLASNSSSKLIPESQNVAPNKESSEKATENCRKGYFVKINMDGVPIGRKVDLKAYDSYEKLSSSVDELFRDLLAAQTESSPGGIQKKQEGDRVITGLLDGSGEYTLVYEDNEGDRMLVGDVPWHMFVSTVKRLRVLKTSELSTLRCGNKKEKIPS